MSHNPESTTICPNCGYTAHYNYCARCGQETHLHSDTFIGLVNHFIGHYFHYDSKFWTTIKTLVFKPGQLTIAYWNKQRMRYIPPISLYIFISAIFFLIGTLTHTNDIFTVQNGEKHAVHFGNSTTKTIQDTVSHSPGDVSFSLENPGTEKGIWGYLDRKMEQLDKNHKDNTSEYLAETVNHSIPKIFFFTIPLIAFLLQLLFLRRKQPFADHAIFTLHFQSFTFLLAWLEYIPFPHAWHTGNILAVLAFVYLIIALHKVYHTGWIRAVLYSLLLEIAYVFLFFTGIFIIFTLILATA